MDEIPNLKAAYALRGPDEIRALYEQWATSYDAAFGEAQGYQLHREVARAFLTHGGSGPVLDVGAGTGLVGAMLKDAGIGPIDALDLSAEMLAVAETKAVYRDLICADVTRPLGLPGGSYAGIVSAGTFTHGHVDGTGLPPLLEVARPGCRIVLSVNAQHYKRLAFEASVAALGDRVEDVATREVRIYDDRADSAHRQDKAIILSFRAV